LAQRKRLPFAVYRWSAPVGGVGYPETQSRQAGKAAAAVGLADIPFSLLFSSSPYPFTITIFHFTVGKAGRQAGTA
jgi:hypothetical protein